MSLGGNEFDSDAVQQEYQARLRENIKRDTQHHIEEKAAELGAFVRAEVELSDAEYPVPVSVRLVGLVFFERWWAVDFSTCKSFAVSRFMLFWLFRRRCLWFCSNSLGLSSGLKNKSLALLQCIEKYNFSVSSKNFMAISISFRGRLALFFPKNFTFSRIFFINWASVIRFLFFNCLNAAEISFCSKVKSSFVIVASFSTVFYQFCIKVTFYLLILTWIFA